MNSLEHKYITKLCCDSDPELLAGCISPCMDIDKSCHFVDPIYYEGVDAIDKIWFHLSEYILTNNREELGRAIHYVEDICIPKYKKENDPSRDGLNSIISNEVFRFNQEFSASLIDYNNINNNIRFENISDLIKFAILEPQRLMFNITDRCCEEKLQDFFDFVTNVVSEFYRIVCEKNINVVVVPKERLYRSRLTYYCTINQHYTDEEVRIINDNGVPAVYTTYRDVFPIFYKNYVYFFRTKNSMFLDRFSV